MTVTLLPAFEEACAELGLKMSGPLNELVVAAVLNHITQMDVARANAASQAATTRAIASGLADIADAISEAGERGRGGSDAV